MIVKDYEQPVGELDLYAKAGAKAESTLAHYLKRKFAESKKVYVFNGMRLQDESGDAAQIDHLIVHKHGFIVIESKSVTSRINVNPRGEWARFYNGQWSGMSSPIEQAKRQASYLKSYLNKRKGEIRSKVALVNKAANFSIMAFDYLVAISDSGIVEGNTEGVYKADQIPDQAEAIIKRHRRAAIGLRLSLTDGMDSFNDSEIERLQAFLLKSHRPIVFQRRANSSNDADGGRAPAPTASLCKSCGKDTLHILYGKYGYYFKCLACNETMSIDSTCTDCGNRARIRKDKDTFWKECNTCKSSKLFHKNSNKQG